jgi:hypothetical protein
LKLSLVALSVIGCSAGPAAPVEASAAPSAPLAVAVSAAPSLPISASPTGSGTASAQGSCDAVLAEYKSALAAASNVCSSDADCACYGVLPMDNQTAVGDRKSANALDAIGKRYHDEKCPTVCVQSVPSKCQPRCASGRCR